MKRKYLDDIGVKSIIDEIPKTDKRHIEPVKGWKTENAGERSICNGSNVIKEKFFKVIKCPLYEVG